tara:strand:- start:34 stop:1212 length:1179 start_codon:yes stop_codon:yes gene_type:complete
MADDIRELNALIADYGKEFQSPDPRRGPSLGSARLYNEDYQPATGSQQAEMVMSMLPGVGEGLDAAHLAKDMSDRNYLGAGLSGLSLVVPGLGAATIKKLAGKDKTSEELLSSMYKNVKKKNPDTKVTEAEFLNNLKNIMDDGTVTKRREASLTDESIQKAQQKFTQNRAGADTLTPAQQARYIMELHRNAELPSVSVSKQGYVTGSDDQPLTLYHMTHSKEPFDDFNLTTEGRLPFLSTSTTPKGAEIGSAYAVRKVLGETGSRTIPMKARATKILDFENPGHLSELSKYMKENRANTDTEFDDALVDQMIDDMLQGNWAVLEKPRAREAMQKLGFDAFTTTEGGAKNVMLMDPTRQVEPLFDRAKTGMIGKYRRGGSVVERSNNYEPKAI